MHVLFYSKLGPLKVGDDLLWRMILVGILNYIFTIFSNPHTWIKSFNSDQKSCLHRARHVYKGSPVRYRPHRVSCVSLLFPMRIRAPRRFESAVRLSVRNVCTFYTCVCYFFIVIRNSFVCFSKKYRSRVWKEKTKM